MLTLTRFCSYEEAERLQRGDVLYNYTDHYKGGRGGSVSVGFCFTKALPGEAWPWLKGNVHADVVMRVRIPRGRLNKSMGRYRRTTYHQKGDRYLPQDPEGVYRVEWCTTVLDPAWIQILEVLDVRKMFGKGVVEACNYIYDHKQRIMAVKPPTR